MAASAAPDPRMPPLSLRRLTAGERALCAEVFGPGLESGRVRLLALPVWPRPFVPNGGLVVWPAASALADFSQAPLWLRSVLVHELVHVWQAQQGVNLLAAKIRAGDSAASYRYPSDCTSWAALNIEQQASLVEHRFRLSQGQAVPAGAAFYDRLCPFEKPNVSHAGLD